MCPGGGTQRPRGRSLSRRSTPSTAAAELPTTTAEATGNASAAAPRAFPYGVTVTATLVGSPGEHERLPVIIRPLRRPLVLAESTPEPTTCHGIYPPPQPQRLCYEQRYDSSCLPHLDLTRQCGTPTAAPEGTKLLLTGVVDARVLSATVPHGDSTRTHRWKPDTVSEHAATASVSELREKGQYAR